MEINKGLINKILKANDRVLYDIGRKGLTYFDLTYEEILDMIYKKLMETPKDEEED